ncbi:MAG TPA: M18 family aminopeptidase [Gammaproteobacteria bacterium]|nr:M18 family aminopeptidase [Gammaproteobacteria bacterium]
MNPESFNSGLIPFLDASPSPFHAVASMQQALQAKGFSDLDPTATWSVGSSEKVLITRNHSSLIAFRTGKAPLADTGIRMIGAHTDSPCLRIKPSPDVRRSGMHQLGAEVYGGMLLAPWFDRDLSIAGRVTCTDVESRRLSLLIDFERPIVTVPSLAIHLNRDIHKNRTINPQKEVVPILCDLAHQSGSGFHGMLLDQVHHQHPGSNVQAVTDYELSCYDTQGAQQVGINGDYLASARLDNLLSCYAGLHSLLNAETEQSVLLVCNDHEEVGSASAAGAQGPFLRTVLERLCGDAETLARVLERSLLVSVDNAHALHPNYENKHDPEHQPRLNGGPVIKFNANQRYATNSATAATFRQLCTQAGVPVQSIAMRSDMACGSTIGPITSTVLGVDTVDVGAPQLGMHSIRETTGWKDPVLLYRVLRQLFESDKL